jgi:hypothetical protein
MLDWNDNLDRVIAELPEHQIQQIVTDLDVGELADLALAVEPHRFGAIVQAVPVDTVADIAVVLLERGEHSAMLGFTGVITAEMLTAALTKATRDQLDGLVAEVANSRSWAELDRLSDGLDEESRGRLLTILRDAPAEAFSILQAAARAGHVGASAVELLGAANDLRSGSRR